MLTAAVVITAVALLWMSYAQFQAHRYDSASDQRQLKLTALKGSIVHLDEVLTMSARLAALTGDAKWDERYRHFEPILDATIKEADQLAPSKQGHEAAIQTGAANLKLAEMEHRALDMVRSNRPQEARAVLFSDEYEQQKQIYAQGMTQIGDDLAAAIDASDRLDQKEATRAVLLECGVGLLLVVAWGFVLSNARRSQSALDAAYVKQTEAAGRLAELNRGLDQTVAERTKDLETSRVAALNMMEDAFEARNASEALNAELKQQITQRQRAEESQARLAAAVEQAAEAIMITDAKAEILYVNPAFERFTGYSRREAVGQNARILKSGKHDAAYYEQIWATLARGESWEGRFINKRKDGSLYEEESTISAIRGATGEIISYVAVKRDITDRLKDERLAQRSQRLEAIGTLVGGVAHDLNNALAPIMMGAELLRMRYPGEASLVDMFQTSAQRGADMVRQLLSFAKGAEGERVLIQLNQLLKEMKKLMEGTFPKDIQLAVKTDPKLPTFLGDPTQMHQILLNLCVNARDAMPNGGILTVEAHRQEVDATFASSIPDAKPGLYVALRVHDTGTGIPPEILEKIFDPFFTTKGPTKGTGLGLSTVMGIVKGHGGFIRVYSDVGQGSTFTVYLPAELAGVGQDLATKVEVDFRGQGEVILFVDDEPILREVARAVLRHLNFTPLTATDGADALIQVTEHRTELRAIITDLHMPHMDGMAFVRALRRILPDLPVIVSSGRMDDAVLAEFKTLGVANHLNKPFTEAQLADALNRLLAP